MKKLSRPLFLLPFFLLVLRFDLYPQTPPLDRKIEEIVRAIAPDMVALRRDIHAHPELSLEEKRTAALVADRFKALGLEVRTGIGGTGVLAVLRGGKPGPVVGFRADLDALPVTEETGLPFASKERAVRDGREVGVMHACGHDVHTTVLLGVATVLARLKSDIAGTILFVAQPAEEGGDGARRMLEDGLFRDVKPAAMFAFHVDDSAPAGVIKYVPGYVMANSDSFSLAIFSEGCHGANAHLCLDPIVVGAQVVLALQVMISRQIDVHHDTVITVGSFHAGSASNIVPQRADLKATVRTYGDDQRRLVREKVERTIAGVCQAAGARYSVDYTYGLPATYNDPELTKRAAAVAERVVGRANVIQGEAGMIAEDFSYFGREAPAALLRLGTQPKGGTATLHSPYFMVDEDSIPVGIRVMSAILLDALARLGLAPSQI
jgi:amidohydrolase